MIQTIEHQHHNHKHLYCTALFSNENELLNFRAYCNLINFDPWSCFIGYTRGCEYNFFNYVPRILPNKPYNLQFAISFPTIEVIQEFNKLFENI